VAERHFYRNAWAVTWLDFFRTLAPALVTPVADSGRVLPITDQQNAGHIYNAPKDLVINQTNS